MPKSFGQFVVADWLIGGGSQSARAIGNGQWQCSVSLPFVIAFCHCLSSLPIVIASCHCLLPLPIAIAHCSLSLPMAIAYCLCLSPLPIANCRLPFAIAYCHCLLSLPIAHCDCPLPLPIAHCLLPIAQSVRDRARAGLTPSDNPARIVRGGVPVSPGPGPRQIDPVGQSVADWPRGVPENKQTQQTQQAQQTQQTP